MVLSGIIKGKIRPPDPPDRRVPRHRVTRLLQELESSYGFVLVTGSAGAGKTTAVLDAVSNRDRALAWLTLDSADAAPGRLLTYLEASLQRALPELPSAARAALGAEATHIDAAGLLAEALIGHKVTQVVDELERILDSSEARETLSGFLRYAPSSVHVILISRRSALLRLGAQRELAGLGRVGEEHLSFTVEEAAAALEAIGASAVDAPSAVEATGGWVTGVLFEAWRSPSHVYGLGGEADPLSGYLSSEIMNELSAAERDFLISTSLLAEITAQRAEALGVNDAAERMKSLRERRLPVAYSSDRVTMRCHPRFREYLQAQLHQVNPDRVSALTRAYGELLVSERHYEEAVDALLAAGDREAAVRITAQAVPAVLQRHDLALADRWLNEFSDEVIQGSRWLTLAQLLCAIEREQWLLGAQCADRLLAMDDSGPLDADIVVATASCYYQVSRLDEALAVIQRAPQGPKIDAMRFAIGVDLVGDGTSYRDRPRDCGNRAVDGMLARHDFAHGRFERLLGATKESTPTRRSHEIAALRALGRLDEALELLRQSNAGGWTMTRVYTELMADLGRPEEARAALRSGRPEVDRSGPGFRMFELLLEASLALRLDRDTAAARRALVEVEREPTATRRRRIVEQLALWKGLAALIDEDNETAAAHLRQAVAVMTEWDRLLFLPAAAVYLAEAEWRLENESAADAAADIALSASRRTGSDHLLLKAAREFPAVVARRLDAERESDSGWHETGRKLMGSGHIEYAASAARVRVIEFGRLAIRADGHEIHVKLTKGMEILAYLAASNGHATRNELLDALFESRSDESARSYLRQALNRLRQALPADAPLTVANDEISWEAEGTLTSDSVQLQRRLEQAGRLRGRSLLEATAAALSMVEAGEYLPEVRTAWADFRRSELESIVNDAKHAAGLGAYELGEYQLADELVQDVLTNDPYRETSWRLAMKVAAAMGDDDRVIARYRRCQTALTAVSTEPTASTLQLLERLRR